MNILHLSGDDKFTDIALRGFEKVHPNSNRLIVYSKNNLCFVKSSCDHTRDMDYIFNLVQSNNFDFIVIHCLNNFWYELILALSPEVKVVWIGWGYDYYDLIDINLFLPLTLKLKGGEGFIEIFKKKLRKNKKLKLKKKVVERIDYFCPVLESEFYVIKNKYNWFRFPKYIDFNYGSIDVDFTKGFSEELVNGNSILVGNSATYENNHLDVFEILNKINKNDLKLIIPLSYGDEDYKDKIIKTCDEIVGNEKKQYLVNYMSIEDYVDIIRSCGNVIMGHLRQQALGNILIMLFLGAKIFLYKENPIYLYLISSGFKVYSIEQLLLEPELLEIPLCDNDIACNKRNLEKLWSEKSYLLKIENLINTVVFDNCDK